MRGTARLRHLTLRGRLVAVLLACLLASCVVVAAATTFALRRFLLDRLDQQLAAAGSRYAVSLEHAGDQDADDRDFVSVAGQPAGTLGARIAGGLVTAMGVVGAPADAPGGTAASRAALARLAPTRGPRTINVPDLGEYRVIVTPGRDGDVLVTGLPEHPVDETITRLLGIETVVFLGALLVSGIVAAVCVRLSLRPLTRVAATALQVSRLPLASGEVSIPDRVTDPAPGTEVGQVAEAFDHMLEHVESALSVRQASEDQLRRFIADASHELRTPVAVIRSHAEYAQRVGADLPGEVEHALGRITAESDRMSMLVDDLLLLARLDSGRPLAREPVDLTRVTLDAVRDAQVAGPEHRWRLDLADEPISVRGDEHVLHQALANLLANARAHTPPGTTVTVSLHRLRGGRRPALLTVLDDGPGVPPNVQPQIFERFVHGTSAARGASAGSGLGLSIVAAIVRGHDGRIELISGPGHTEFRIELPTDQPWVPAS
jgi:two-component system OmpR family sensor kinase